MGKIEDYKIKLSEIEEIPFNDFSKLTELIKKGICKLGVNYAPIVNLKTIKGMFKFSDYILIKLTGNFVYLLILLLIIGSIIFSNYYLLIGMPLFLILKNSGALDIWISIIISVILLILILLFSIDNSTFYILLFGSFVTYITSKISFRIYIIKLKAESLKTEKNFCLLFQLNLIILTDVRMNVIYTIDNNKST